MRGVSARGAAIASAFLVTIAVSACAPEPAEEPTPAPSASASASPIATPTPTPVATPPTAAADLVAEMTVLEKAAAVVMGYAAGTDPAALAGYVAAGPQGVILMGDNVPADPDALGALTSAIAATADPPPLIAIDQEGGVVSRLPWDDLASARDLKGADPTAIEEAFAGRGELLAEAGVTVNFGVVADVPRGDGSFIFSRAFGTDPSAVADAIAAAVRGEDDLVLTTLKHFPGHGAAEGDSHHLIPATNLGYDAWRAGDALPFAAGIDAGAELVMMGHLRFTAVDDRPASLSPEWYRILRDELGFDGVAVTDDLGMLLSSGEAAYADPAGNAVAALAAGADLVLMVAGSDTGTAGAMIDGIAEAIHDGSLPDERLDEAAARVLALRLAS
ncbi:glycoside hydrolase family 3 N-terminal domain-containing protein [Microbacterium karelineae]|uniref:glycoside hydrolase family 3 N-terminal domain-containing protein n=1 Tax=Microbacterium karelineae TaxID=2654283 RepID=UPI001E3C2075|nr:glycoside hydrolase family 3 N-terminal domain-containing protein [Microbacterium karelineae]